MPRSPVIPRDEAISRLHAWGYFPNCVDAVQAASEVGPAEFDEALQRYQAFHGLEPDGYLGPKTAHVMNNPLRCGLPDFLGDGECAWPMKRVTYRPRIRLPGLSDAEAQRAYDEAAAQISAVCGIRLTRIAEGTAHIMARSGSGRANNLDARGGTLAWSYLPCGASERTSLDQMFDEAEQWSYAMAVAVICHELGHAVGLPHLAAGTLMQPYYSSRITRPQAGDIAELVRRYGPPEPTSPAPPVPPASPDKVIAIVTMQINGRWYAGNAELSAAA